ncbi:MAG: UbiA family prenyltransferase [Candidatus Altiarchaeota archaeon]|nr:UbiA family prenyltransferase [Candidatus Altiarchaeota archaeon]
MKGGVWGFFEGFYEQYLIPAFFMLLAPAVLQANPAGAILALSSIMLGILGDITINRVYDSDDDALEEWKRKTNPISNGTIGKKMSFTLSVGIYIAGMLCALLTKDAVFFAAMIARTFLGFTYSGPPVRAKAKPILDLAYHVTIIDAGPAFMAVVYTRNFTAFPLYLLGFAVINSLFTQTSQELRDFDIDRKAKLKTTVQMLGKNNSLRLQRTLLTALCLYALAAGASNHMPYLAAASAIAILYLAGRMGQGNIVVHRSRMKLVGMIAAGFIAQMAASWMT